MSFLNQDLIDQAAMTLDDLSKGRVSSARWLLCLNDSIEEMTLNYRILERDYTFDLEANEDAYTYPDDAVQMSWLQYNETPSDNTTWIDVPEKRTDQMRRIRNFQKPTGDCAYRYLARRNWLEITPRPTATITDGLKITCWRIGTFVIDPATDFELPTMLRKLTKERMLIEAKTSLGSYDERAQDLQMWEDRMSKAVEKIEDRSDDMPPRLVPATLRNMYGNMV